jgi:hypothetical protein
MKAFRCLVGVRQPAGLIAAAVRDQIALVAPLLEQVERIVTVSRVERPDGGLTLVNEWQVSPQVPAGLESLITRDMLGWLDHAEWAPDLSACRWRVEPFFMRGSIRCEGVTRFEPAMGGRGARASFEGGLDVDPGAISAVPMAWRAPASLALEFLVGTLIPGNFRKTVEAAATLLEAAGQPQSAP